MIWIGRLIPPRELRVLANTNRWFLSIRFADDKNDHERFLCDNETGDRWELKSLVLDNGERVNRVVGFEKGDRE